MIGIKRPAVHVAASDYFGGEFFALLLDDPAFSVVARHTTGHETIKRRVSITASINADDVIDHRGNLKFADVQAHFAQRVPLQFDAA